LILLQRNCCIGISLYLQFVPWQRTLFLIGYNINIIIRRISIDTNCAIWKECDSMCTTCVYHCTFIFKPHRGRHFIIHAIHCGITAFRVCHKITIILICFSGNRTISIENLFVFFHLRTVDGKNILTSSLADADIRTVYCNFRIKNSLFLTACWCGFPLLFFQIAVPIQKRSIIAYH